MTDKIIKVSLFKAIDDDKLIKPSIPYFDTNKYIKENTESNISMINKVMRSLNTSMNNLLDEKINGLAKGNVISFDIDTETHSYLYDNAIVRDKVSELFKKQGYDLKIHMVGPEDPLINNSPYFVTINPVKEKRSK